MSESAPLNWKVGDVIADLYEVTGVLGEGAFGIVHKVHHRGWDMDLAVKSPRAEILGSEMAVRRFLREAETWVQLGLHPHIASCYYVRNLGGIPRMFIEYADAGTLRDWLRDGKVKDWHTILDIAIQICYGLSFAHKKGLVHRDLKPGNCLMTSDGTLKITDFGLVKLLGDMTRTSDVRDRVPGPEPVRGGTLTGCGSMGTPEYMAPEQWSNPGEATAAADIWAFGVMLYEMTCGRRPLEIQPDEPMDAFYARMIRSNWAYRAPGELRNDVYRRQIELIRRCMKPRVEDRIASIDEVASEIDKLYSRVAEVMPQSRTVVRRPPPEIPSLADTLNNQAVSLIDLGREDEALRLLDDALKVEPSHVQSTFNRGLMKWRRGEITDIGVLTSLKALREVRTRDFEVPLLSGLCNIERGDAESALAELEEASRLASERGSMSGTRVLNKALELAAHMKEFGEVGKCLRIFEGHTKGVKSVSFSPNGEYGLSGSYDKTLRLWELATGKCLRTLEGHTEGVTSVIFSPDGQWGLSSGGSDMTLRLWELATGKCLRTFDHGCAVNSISISPDGRYGLSGGQDGTLRLWDLTTGECVRTFRGHTRPVESVSISRDGRHGLSGSFDRTLRLWDLATGKCLGTFEGTNTLNERQELGPYDRTGRIQSVGIAPDGRYGLSNGDYKALQLWEFATGKCLRTFEGHTGWVESVCISPDGRYGLSGGTDRTLRLWELATGRCLRTFEGHTSWYVHSVSISPDGRYGLSGSSDNTLRLWKLGTGEVAGFIIVRPRLSSQVNADEDTFRTLVSESERAISEGDSRRAVTLIRRARQLAGYEQSSRAMKLQNTASRNATKIGLASAWGESVLHGHTERVYSVSVSADCRHGLSGGRDRTLRFWDLATGECLRTFEGHRSWVNSVTISPDGRYGLSGSNDNTLQLWELATGRHVRTFNCGTGLPEVRVESVCVSSDGRYGLAGSINDVLRLWDLATGKCLRTLEGHIGGVRSVCISPDGRYGLSCGYQILGLWEFATGKCLRTFEGHAREVNSVCISPDGRCGLSGGNDNTLRLWELGTGRCLRTLEGHTDSVNSVCISSDGRYGLSGSSDNTLRLWELATGVCLRILEGHTAEVNSAGMSPDGQYALSGSDDKTVRLWEFDWEYEFPEPKDWDEGVRSFLETFLTLHMRVGLDGISRVGKPVWNGDDFMKLLVELQHRGYGWLRPEGVRRELEKMTTEWKEPPEIQNYARMLIRRGSHFQY
jgi:WD40 repeat protein